jgi:transmembrane sensor
MNRRSNAPVLHAPLTHTLRDPVTEPQLQRMWRHVKARRAASRAPIRSALVGALAGAAATAVVMFAVQRLRRPEAVPVRSVSAVTTPMPLTLSNGSPLRPTDLTGSRATFSDGSQVEMAADTRLEPLVASATEVVLRLARGRTVFDIVPGGPRRWTIEAGIASVEVVGTRFVVMRAPDVVRVDVERGVVLVRGTTVPDGVARVEEDQSIEVHAAAAASTAAHPGPSDVANGRAKSGSRSAWRDSAAHGHYVEAYASLGSGGVERETTGAASVEDLLALSDVARLSGHAAEAIQPLERILRDHASSPSAPLSAVTLGRIELSLARPQEAARALERALALRVPVGLEEDVYVRLVEAHARAGNAFLAASTARTYRARFPGGRRAADVERWSPP